MSNTTFNGVDRKLRMGGGGKLFRGHEKLNIEI